MRSYQQLTQEQRYQIYALKENGHMQCEVADAIGVHKSTISRELHRNRGQPPGNWWRRSCEETGAPNKCRGG